MMIMEKINIAELLNDCPKGMELDCTMYDNLYFDSVEDDYYRTINCYTLIDGIKTSITFTMYGTYNNHTGAKCVIFPKGKTTWEGFQRPFKDGDIVAGDNRACSYITIFREFINNTSFSHHVCLTSFGKFKVDGVSDNANLRFATDEEKQKLFDAIKAKGYHWNAETKTLENLIESKEDTDDKIVMAGIYFDRENYADEVELYLGNYEIEIRDGKTYAVFKNQKTKTLENLPKFKVGDKIQKKDGLRVPFLITGASDVYYWSNTENSVEILSVAEQDDWELVPTKFDNTTLKPLDKVLMRSSNAREWTVTLYSHYNNNKFYGCGMCCDQCIPYEHNEQLRGTTNDCNEYYKTWE